MMCKRRYFNCERNIPNDILDAGITKSYIHVSPIPESTSRSTYFIKYPVLLCKNRWMVGLLPPELKYGSKIRNLNLNNLRVTLGPGHR